VRNSKNNKNRILHVSPASFYPAGARLGPGAGASEHLFQLLQDAIVRYASWYYVLVVAIVLVSILLFSLSRFGDIKLGPDHAEPAYSGISWFSMLFAAGMGIGLMFFGVAEPVMHFLQPPHGWAARRRPPARP
jgi:choline/glycine/proline betaine transport protein